MSKFDSLNDTFNTDDSVEVDAIVKAEDNELQKSQTRAENVEKDYDYTRGNLYSLIENCLLYTSPSPRDATLSRMPSSA